jgi:TRAP-type C4-dicarboxylate transport system permease small subunit
VLWLVALLAAILEPWGRSRVLVHAVRRRQRWFVALVACASFLLALGLALVSLHLASIVATLGTINIDITRAALTLLVSGFGIATGLLVALPLTRVRRVRFR